MTQEEAIEKFNVDPKTVGFLEHTMRKTFRDLCRVYGFGGAREIVAQIINDEADRRHG